jgi:hypothetical protein
MLKQRRFILRCVCFLTLLQIKIKIKINWKNNENYYIQLIDFIKSEIDYFAQPWTLDGQIVDTKFHQASAISFKSKFKETRNV